MTDDTDIRIINGHVAKPSTGDAWETPDGKRYWFCAGEYCPGVQWKPSNTAHPSTCSRPPTAASTPAAQAVQKAHREGTMLDLWRGVQTKHTDIMAFFEWLYAQGYEVEFTKDRDPRPVGRPSDLIDRYLGIDRVQLDNERRELLASLDTGGS